MPEKTIKVKATSKRKSHKRVIHFEGKREFKLHDGINNVDLITTSDRIIKRLLVDGEWNIKESTYYNHENFCRDSLFHVEGGKIYGISDVKPIDKSAHIYFLETNPDQRRQGYGIKIMSDIVKTIVDSENFNKIELTSADPDSDKFYDAIGMIKIGKDEFSSMNKYEGDKEWMKEFIKSTSKKQ